MWSHLRPSYLKDCRCGRVSHSIPRFFPFGWTMNRGVVARHARCGNINSTLSSPRGGCLSHSTCSICGGLCGDWLVLLQDDRGVYRTHSHRLRWLPGWGHRRAARWSIISGRLLGLEGFVRLACLVSLAPRSPSTVASRRLRLVSGEVGPRPDSVGTVGFAVDSTCKERIGFLRIVGELGLSVSWSSAARVVSRVARHRFKCGIIIGYPSLTCNFFPSCAVHCVSLHFLALSCVSVDARETR